MKLWNRNYVLKNPPPLQTKEANKKDTVAESHDDISEAFTLLQSAKMKINSTTVTELTKTATTPGTIENVGFGPEERKAKLIKVQNICVFFSSRSLKTRETCISFAQFVYFLREI